jgi:hypothetical protein
LTVLVFAKSGWKADSGSIWAEDRATQGCDSSADSVAGRNWRRRARLQQKEAILAQKR